MKKGIHPKYEVCKVTCACGNTFENKVDGGRHESFRLQRLPPLLHRQKGRVIEAGRLEKFRQKYAGVNYGQKSAKETAE